MKNDNTLKCSSPHVIQISSQIDLGSAFSLIIGLCFEKKKTCYIHSQLVFWRLGKQSWHKHDNLTCFKAVFINIASLTWILSLFKTKSVSGFEKNSRDRKRYLSFSTFNTLHNLTLLQSRLKKFTQKLLTETWILNDGHYPRSYSENIKTVNHSYVQQLLPTDRFKKMQKLKNWRLQNGRQYRWWKVDEFSFALVF